MPCSSFSVLQNLNEGTRSLENPEGNGTLPREILGNSLALRVGKLCKAFVAAGGFFTIENPKSSYLWKYDPIARLDKFSIDVDFDQCCYDLWPPHAKADPSLGKIKKPTRLRTNMHELSILAAKCCCTVKHFHCLGSVKVDQAWVKVSVEAGKYPPKLCERWAAAVASAIDRVENVV